MIKNTKVGAVGTQTRVLDKNNKKQIQTEFPCSHEEIYAKLLSGESMRFETALIDKTRLPKDVLKFKRNTHYPFVYADVFMKIGLYKQLANLKENLIVTRINESRKDLISIEKRLSFIKLLFESTTLYQYKPSIRSLFAPLIKQI